MKPLKTAEARIPDKMKYERIPIATREESAGPRKVRRWPREGVRSRFQAANMRFKSSSCELDEADRLD